MSGNVLDSFFVALGFDIDTTKLDEFKAKTADLRETVLKFGAVAAGAAAGLGLLVEHVAGSLGEIYSFAELNEMSARSVAALGKIATENDGSLEGMKSTIQSLNKVIGEAALGIGRGAMTFEKLKLSAKNADGSVKGVDDILAEVADKMQGLSRQEQIAMAEKLGIDPQFVKVLEKGSANLAKLREEAELMNPFTERDYMLADQVDKLFIKAKATVGIFTKMLGASLLPQAKEVLTTYLEWFKQSRKEMAGPMVKGLQAISAALGTVWDWVVRVVRVGRDFYDAMAKNTMIVYAAAFALGVFVSVKAYEFIGQVGSAIISLTSKMVAFNATALVIPAIIGAIVIALGLLIDDYTNWKEGNDSIIGDLVEKFPWLLDVIKGIEKAVGALVDFWVQQWNTISTPVMELAASLWKLASILIELLWPIVKEVFIGWAYIAAAVIPIIASIVGWIAETLVEAIAAVINAGIWLADAFTTVFTGIKAGIDLIVGAFDFAKQKVTDFISMITGAISKVADFFGITGGNAGLAINATQNNTSEASAPSSGPAASGGVVGNAGNSTTNSNVTQSTTITGTQITVQSPDPDKAGQAVKRELERMNRQATRNGQTGVGL